MNKILFIISCVTGFLFINQVYSPAQEPTIWYNQEHVAWPSALSGGFIAPQFSMFDMNQDGRQEMVTFDRYSGIIQVWASDGDELGYKLETDFPVEWPEIQSWMLIRDFNQDQIPDIFTQGLHGIAVFKGVKDGEVIRFEKMSGPSFIDDSLLFQHKSGSTTNIFHGAADIPIIEDVDGDGDLDILTFELSGSFLYYYENRWDKTGKELDFTLRHTCWGYFAENLYSEEINISDGDPVCPPPFSVRHSGSTSCLIDVNHDTLPDLILGDIGTNSLKILINKGNRDTAMIKEVRAVFPNEKEPAILNYFPAAYKVDVNQDSINDVIIAVNEYPLTDLEGVWLYEGTGNAEQPFRLHSDQWLSNKHIDLGQYSSPFFIDVNGDGQEDVLVGYQETLSADKPINKIAYFEALGEREYQLQDLDFGDLATELVSGYRPYLTSGDIDGDGDIDILVGMSSGTCYLLYNGSGNSRKFQLEKVEKDALGLHLQSGATPELFDIDGDGDLDIIAGTDNGTIGLYINTGTPSEPVFDTNLNQHPNVGQLGKIRTVNENSLVGRSAPRVITRDSDTILLSGSYGGRLFAYQVNPDDLTSDFKQVYPEDWPRRSGGNGRVAIHPANGNETHFLMGNVAGGLTEKIVSKVSTIRGHGVDPVISLYPNPANAGERIHIKGSASRHIKQIKFYFSSGQLLYTDMATHSLPYQFSTFGWPPGVYFLHIVLQDNRSVIQKVIVQ